MAKFEAAPRDGDVYLRTLTERMRIAQSGTLPRNLVAVDEVVAAVLDAMAGRLSATEANLLREVAGLGRIIDQAKVGIAEVSVDAIRGTHIPSATGELDAIVQHTGEATESILGACEALDNLGATLSRDHATVLQGATTAIYEACSFQDITGQRITKVVKALQDIEARVKNLSITYALSVLPEGHVPALQDHVPTGQAAFLNGPAPPAAALDQSDIDKLMADL